MIRCTSPAASSATSSPSSSACARTTTDVTRPSGRTSTTRKPDPRTMRSVPGSAATSVSFATPGATSTGTPASEPTMWWW